MDPMRYLREKAEARAFGRQGKQLPKAMMGMEPKMDDATVALANKWDAMPLRDKYMYVTQNASKYAEPYFPGQNVEMTKKSVIEAWNNATRG